MPFRLRRDARKWFRDIEPKLNLDFDMYYFCLMAGLAARRKENVKAADTTELVDNFPGEYRTRSRLIVALFLSRELESMGIQLSDRKALHAAVARLVDPRSPSDLSDEGMNLINRYSYGGFDALAEWFEDRPRAIETFLPLYKRKLDEALASGP